MIFKSRLHVKPTIISFFGKMASGKDTAGEIARKYAGFKRMAFGDELKRIVWEKYHPLCGDPAKFRELCQKEGQMSRAIYPDVWVDMFDRKLLEEFLRMEAFNEIFRDLGEEDEELKIVVTDMRQPNEYEYLKSLGAVMVKIVADDDIRAKRIYERDGYQVTKSIFNHETEQWVDTFEYDFLIENNGVKEDFTENVLNVLQKCCTGIKM